MTIRRTPQDFVVHELLSAGVRQGLSPSASTSAMFAVYELTKTSMTTPDAVQWLAKSLGVKTGEITYAGLKDKHAHSVQYVAVRTAKGGSGGPAVPAGSSALGGPAVPAGSGSPALPEKAEGQGWSASRIGWSADELSASSIDGNRFTIVVRDLSRETNREMQRRANLLMQRDESSSGSGTSTSEHATQLAFVNYFGDQRFGSARHGQGWVAEHLMRGEFEQALRLSIATPARKDSGKKRTFSRLAATKWGDWKTLAVELPRSPERRAIEELAAGKNFRDAFASLPYFFQQMCVEAYQSHVWNEMAARFISGSFTENAPSLIETDDPFGKMLFPAAAQIHPTWMNLDVPIIGHDSVLGPSWDRIGRLTLQERGFTQDQLRIPGLRRPAFGDALRPLFAVAQQFTMSHAEPDDLGRPQRLKRTLTFDLPRGAYATVVLRALGQ